MLARRPWASTAALHDDAAAVWAGLDRDDFLQAFAQHPRIGAGGNDAWSRQEQAAAGDADGETQRALRAANDRYVDRFGYIFIVCATGKSAAEMLRLLEARLDNDPRSRAGDRGRRAGPDHPPATGEAGRMMTRTDSRRTCWTWRWGSRPAAWRCGWRSSTAPAGGR